MRALQDITILDLTHMLSGPYGTMLLADMGARTIKIEPPRTRRGHAAAARALRTLFARRAGRLFPHALPQQGERRDRSEIARQGLELFYRSRRRADVVVSNFGAGVTQRLKIDYPHLSAINPRIITCSVSGFGESGPAPDRPAFDLVAQGMGGGMSLTGYADGEPLRAGIPIGDLAGGMFGAIGILSALQARHTTGRGQNIDISMFDCQLSLLNYMATMYLMSGKRRDDRQRAFRARALQHVPHEDAPSDRRRHRGQCLDQSRRAAAGRCASPAGIPDAAGAAREQGFHRRARAERVRTRDMRVLARSAGQMPRSRRARQRSGTCLFRSAGDGAQHEGAGAARAADVSSTSRAIR